MEADPLKQPPLIPPEAVAAATAEELTARLVGHADPYARSADL